MKRLQELVNADWVRTIEVHKKTVLEKRQIFSYKILQDTLLDSRK